MNDYILEICDILDIAVPQISFDNSKFPTKTTMAQCSPDGKVIFIKNIKNPNPDYYFAIAHELRHIWQLKEDAKLYFSSYKPINLCRNNEQYNLQLAEIDANAFAALIMIDFFHISPLFDGMPENVILKIQNRMNEIIQLV